VKKFAASALLFLAFFFIPAVNYADDAEVIEWTQQTLLNTFSVGHDNIDQQLAAVKNHYTNDAWQAMGSFFSTGVNTIHTQQLVLHPTLITPAHLVDEGDYSGIHYWRINQVMSIPEFNTTISFSVVVIKATNPPYLIQSLMMERTANE